MIRHTSFKSWIWVCSSTLLIIILIIILCPSVKLAVVWQIASWGYPDTALHPSQCHNYMGISYSWYYIDAQKKNRLRMDCISGSMNTFSKKSWCFFCSEENLFDRSFASVHYLYCLVQTNILRSMVYRCSVFFLSVFFGKQNYFWLWVAFYSFNTWCDCYRVSAGMLGERGLWLVAHFPWGDVADVFIYILRDHDRDCDRGCVAKINIPWPWPWPWLWPCPWGLLQ